MKKRLILRKDSITFRRGKGKTAFPAAGECIPLQMNLTSNLPEKKVSSNRECSMCRPLLQGGGSFYLVVFTPPDFF
jgi:hypothetical protein